MKERLINFIPITFSTNVKMAELIRDNLLIDNKLDELFTVYAGYQKSGKGLATNRWHSEANRNILATIYFTPPLPPVQQFTFNQCFAVSVRQFLTKYVPNVQIKRPNDIYINEKKIAGILIEHTIMGECIQHTIAGVGININQTDFPAELPNPVSLSQLTGKEYSIDKLVRELVEVCEKYYNMLKMGDIETIHQMYMDNLYQYETYHSYKICGTIVNAKIIGIDHYGRLLLQDVNEKVHCCGLKEVVFL